MKLSATIKTVARVAPAPALGGLAVFGSRRLIGAISPQVDYTISTVVGRTLLGIGVALLIWNYKAPRFRDHALGAFGTVGGYLTGYAWARIAGLPTPPVLPSV